MPQSKNMARLSEDMKRELIAIIGGMKDPRVQGFLTVMRVEVAPDLSTAKVHVSKMGHVRSEIAKRMHIRKAPEFRFVADDGAKYAAHINELIAGLEREER